MANFVRSDNSDFSDRTAGQPPIVLARLPRVGADTAAPTSPAQSHAVTQTVPPPEAMPRLDLHTEIDQRARLHIAQTPNDDSSPTTSHFSDRSHAAPQPTPSASTTPPPSPSLSPSPTHQTPSPLASSLQRAGTLHSESLQHSTPPQHSKVAEPKTLSEKIFQLHTQLSPHAGLIVALALIASAGLLYWMIVGPAQVPMPHYEENFGTELSDQGYGSISSYTPEFVAEVPPLTAPQRTNDPSDDQWNELLLPTPPSVEEAPSQLAQPAAQPETEPTSFRELSSPDELFFPNSGSPNDLDFTQLPSVLPSRPVNDALQPLPPLSEVADRPSTTLTR